MLRARHCVLLLIFFPSFRNKSLLPRFLYFMSASKLNCLNCERLFVPDYRNRTRQRYCRKADCQRARRADSQRTRRSLARAGTSLRETTVKPPEAPCEAACTAQDFAFVGLVSVLSNATTRDELNTIIQGLTARGQGILGLFDAQRDAKIS